MTVARPCQSVGGALAILALAALPCAEAVAQGGAPSPERAAMLDALARATQNPVANLYSLPIQNNTNFQYGPNGHIQNVLNIQPVLPFGISEDWNIITRTIVPVISQPEFVPGEGTTFGLGLTTVSAFLSPAKPGKLIWGVGVVAGIPTTTNKALGSNAWGAGPTAVGLVMEGPWVIGGLVNNLWSIDASPNDTYNLFTFQPFINYNFGHGTYVSFSPIITADWEAKSGQQWTVPLGLAAGQIFFIGNQPLNAQLGAYYNVVRPDIGPEWQLRFQVAFLFPR
jgi:hypothetical protein